MPFMIGQSPIRRTLKYLNKCEIYFRDIVKIFTVNYYKYGQNMQHHEGVRDFIFWHLPQIQYKNPNVQCLSYRDLTPSPFIRIFLEDGKSILIDCDSRNKDEIYEHLKDFAAVCKTKEELEYEKLMEQRYDNPANFGYYCERQCMCEVFGQAPCSSLVPMPFYRRGMPRYVEKRVRIPDYIKFEELEEARRKEQKKKY